MKRDLWRYRVLQLSPLLVIALMATAWFGVPTEARTTGLMPLLGLGAVGSDGFVYSADETQVTVMQAILRQQKGLEPWEGVTSVVGWTPLGSLAGSVSSALADVEPEVLDETGAPRELGAAEAVLAFERIDEYEAEYDAAVAVFVISSDPAPPVAVSSVASESVLTDAERTELEDRGTLESIRRLVAGGGVGPVWADLHELNGGTGESYDDRFIGHSAFTLEGHIWETYTLAHNEYAGQPLMAGMWQSVTDPAVQQSADAIARAGEGAAFVVGPIDAGHHVVRPARGLTAEETAGLWRLAESRRLEAMTQGPVGIGRDLSAIAGGADLVEAALVGSGRAPRVALIALYDTHPATHALWEQIGRSPITVLRVWMGTYPTFILGVLAVLLLASVVASAVAFRAERLYRERIEVERERARVQREAELRVISKLDELSARMDSLRERASSSTAAGVEGVSEDIESTVAELRSILGSVAEGGDGDA